MQYSIFAGLTLLATGCAVATTPPMSADPGPAVAQWESASVNDETQSTHLWIVDRAVDLLRSQGADPAASGAVGLLDRADCLPSWHQGLLDADYKAIYNDGRSDLEVGAGVVAILVAGSSWASHFYDPDTGLNYKGQSSPTGRTRLTDQLGNFRSAYARGDVGGACYALGLSLHYFTDMTQPMHAANYTAKDWPLELHSHVEVYAMQHQTDDVTTGFTPPAVNVDALVDAVAHTSKSYWAPMKAAIAAAYSARCSRFDSYYKDHTECWQGDAGVDGWVRVSLQSAQSETAQFLYALDLR